MNTKTFMTTEEAFEIVYELALSKFQEGSILVTPELIEKARKQQVALNVVHDFLVNNIYE